MKRILMPIGLLMMMGASDSITGYLMAIIGIVLVGIGGLERSK